MSELRKFTMLKFADFYKPELHDFVCMQLIHLWDLHQKQKFSRYVNDCLKFQNPE